MSQSPDPFRQPFESQTLYPRFNRWLARAEAPVVAIGLAAAVLRPSLLPIVRSHQRTLAFAIIGSLAALAASFVFRYLCSRARTSFLTRNLATAVMMVVWAVGFCFIAYLAAEWHNWQTAENWVVHWSGICVVVRSIGETISLTLGVAMRFRNPALALVASFGLLVTVGTLLLMLPRARAHPDSANQHEGAPLLVALFTATSAGCVTGLTVEPTGTYWSGFGQAIILGLFQIGGLGIMTFSSFFLLAGRQMHVRETATMRDLLESDGLVDARRLLVAILIFMLTVEAIGALLLSGLFSEKTWSEQIFMSVFHSVSAFCNAGFSLTENSFVGMETRWQVWGVLAALIVVGGLGFAVQYNLLLLVTARWRSSTNSYSTAIGVPRHRGRLSLSSKLVLITTTCLLLGGSVGFGALESLDGWQGDTPMQGVANAWFQSVTYRTAGFNTLDHGTLQPATKLFAVTLMFVGASPGSTGGGVKTVCFVLTVLVLFSTLRGRDRVEIFGRTIPSGSIHRALAILFLGMVVLMTTTMLLVVFEDRPDRFLDHLYEAASAFGTVGVSTGITPELTVPSQLVIVATMFLGRVGPLTLLLALAGEPKTSRYDFPVERVPLG